MATGRSSTTCCSRPIPRDPRDLDNTLTVEKQALALPRGDDDFRPAVDGAISELYRSGGIARIFAANLPGAKPGLALKALYLIAPDLP